jgi:MFS transporter, AAHS family, benzoate transport protein
MKSPVQTVSVGRLGGPRPFLSDKAVIALCMIVTIIEGYNVIVFGSVVPLMLTDTSLRIDEPTIGLVGGIIYAGALIGVLGGTALGDRYGRHRVIALAVAVFAAGSALVALAATPEFLGMGRLITGIGIGGAVPAAMTLARNHAPKQRGTLVIAITMAGIPLGGTLAALLGIFLIPVWGWRPMFWLGAGMTLVILVVLLSCRISESAEVRGTTLTPAQKFTALFKGRGWILVLIAALTAGTNTVTWLGLNVWLPASMKSFGFSLTEALIFAFTLTGAAVIGSWFTATAADKFGSAKIGILCAALTLTGVLGILLGPVSFGVALVCIALIGIGGHSTGNLVASTATSAVAPHSRGTILGLTNLVSFIGSFLGPTLGGTAFAANGPAGILTFYSASAILCLILSAGLYVADKSARRETPKTPAVAEPAPALP